MPPTLPAPALSAGFQTRRSMSQLRKRSILLAGHATSIALEPEFWAVLEAMAEARGLSLAGLIAEVDQDRRGGPLASACRVAALDFVQTRGRFQT